MDDAGMADKLRGLADRVPWQDMTRGMSTREISERFGISKAAAWRARTGRTANPKFTGTEDFRNRRAARAFRRIAARTIKVGKVRVEYLGRRGARPEGYRYIPALDLEDPEAIAEAIADGEYLEAVHELNNQIMGAYGAGPGPGEDPYVNIADWPEDLFD